MNCPAMPPGGGRGMKFRKPFRPKTRKITPARYRAIAEAVLITRFSFFDWQPLHGVNHIDVNIVDGVYFRKIQESYGRRYSGDVARLARHVEGDARVEALRCSRNRRNWTRRLGFPRAGSAAP